MLPAGRYNLHRWQKEATSLTHGHAITGTRQQKQKRPKIFGTPDTEKGLILSGAKVLLVYAEKVGQAHLTQLLGLLSV